MRSTPLLRLAQSTPSQAAQPHAYRPLIKFKGQGHHENIPASTTTSTLEPHPASPHATLPDSFARYREKVTQHGPLAGRMGNAAASRNVLSSTTTTGKSDGRTATKKEQSAKPVVDLAFDRSELPARFGRLSWAKGEGEAIESGGASLW